jgi:hypothetical protein
MLPIEKSVTFSGAFAKTEGFSSDGRQFYQYQETKRKL